MTVPMPRNLRDVNRLVVYSIDDRRGDVDAYASHAISALSEHADRLIIVVRGPLSPQGAAALDSAPGEVLSHDGAGGSLSAFRHVVSVLGRGMSEYDEVLFANDRWYGPLSPFGPIFARMTSLDVDFWGMTDERTELVHPETGEQTTVDFIQLHWLVVRRPVLTSSAWSSFWAEQADRAGAQEREIDAGLTVTLSAAGFTSAAAFPLADQPTGIPTLLNADQLIAAGCPLLLRDSFEAWPPFLDHNAVVGRWTLEQVAASDYPLRLVLESLARNVAPKVLNATANLLSVLPDAELAQSRANGPGIVVIAHIYYQDMTDDILRRCDRLPVPYDLIVTTDTAAKAGQIRGQLTEGNYRANVVDVRVVDSNAGRDQSAFWVGTRDVLNSEAYDLVVKVHSKKSPQDGMAQGEHFKQQQFDNLLYSTGYASHVIALFDAEPGLGIVFPPTIHIGSAAVGRGWARNKDGYIALADSLGIRVPVDDVSPLAPFGGMFVARPDALKILSEQDWSYEDFGGEADYRDGGLAHILERMPAYAAAERGYHARTVMNREYMSLSHVGLDFKLDQISATTDGYTDEQITFLRRAGSWGEAKLADLARMYLRLNHPRLDAALVKREIRRTGRG